jgi:hypothetical protein
MMAEKIAEWLGLRAEIAALEQTEHPDLTDRHGRVWIWWQGDLYRHCGMAFPEELIRTAGLPSETVRTNPNYDLCEICRGD